MSEDEIVILGYARGPARKVRLACERLGLPASRQPRPGTRVATVQVTESDRVTRDQWDSVMRAWWDD